MAVKIGVAQMSVIPGNISANEETAKRVVTDLAKRGADVIVLPELWNMGYDLPNLATLAQDSQGSSISMLREIAGEYKVNIIGGSIGEKKECGYCNTSMAIDRNGDILEKYRKVHLFRYGLEEEKHFLSGDQWSLVDMDFGLIGMMLCYDVRFPEFCRNLALRGAEVVFIPAQWPESRIDMWHTLNVARAIENELYVVAVNRCGQDNYKYSGHSMVIAPDGTILFQGDSSEGGYIVEIDIEKVSKMRNMIPTLQDRKNILDEIDNSLL